MIKRKWILAVAVSVVMGAVLLAGCGADANSRGQEAKAERSESDNGETVAGKSAESKEESGDKEAATDSSTDADKDNGTDTADSTEKNNVFGEFTSQTLSGEDADQEVFAQADLTMVNIWGTFCGPCIREMPDLGELNKEYADKGFQIVGMISDVNAPENKDALDIIEATGADYTHLILSQDLYINYLSGVQSVPTTIFVDKNGNQVGNVYSGSKSKADWTEIIEKMLETVKA